MTPLVQLADVRVHFPVRQGFFAKTVAKAVDGVTLELARGETLALVGESGSGKTTLGRVSLRVIAPTAGQVYFDGENITTLSEARLRHFRTRAQAIFQDPYSSLDPFMSVGEILEEPLRLHQHAGGAERRELVYLALREVRLVPEADFVGMYPHQLSGGQRQRVGIARALILAPDYIVADEPVSMIDVSSRAEILGLMRELQERRGLTYLYITHDIATARHFARRIAIMYLGRIVELGPAADIIREPLHPYTVALIDAVPEPDPANRGRMRTAVAGEVPSVTAVPGACRFHPRCGFFMAGKCDVIDPPLVEVQPSRFVACHLYPGPA
jgi:oligopeptide/dipeptide ABC transporter ATP-binding protein